MSARRWLSASETELVRNLRPRRAANIMIQTYADCAAEEALSRALFAERIIDTAGAVFWVSVYERIHRARSEKK